MGGFQVQTGRAQNFIVLGNGVASNVPHVAAEIDDLLIRPGVALNKYVSLVSATQAFRRTTVAFDSDGFPWFDLHKARNIAGDFRGIVRSKKWATIVDVTTDTGKLLASAGVFASFLAQLGQFKSNIDRITSSSASPEDKGAQICTEVSSILFRTAASGALGGVHLFAIAIENAARLADNASGGRLNGLRRFGENVSKGDGLLETTFDKITDGHNMYTFIQAHVIIPPQYLKPFM